VQWGGIEYAHPPHFAIDAQTWVYVTPPNATRSAPTEGDVGQSITASVAVSGGPTPFTEAWSFGDGTKANGSSVEHAYSRTGTFSLNVTVTNSFNVSTVLTGSIGISPRPAVTLSASPISLVSGNVTYTATVTGGTPTLSLSWTLGNGQQATGPGPEVVDYTSAGNFSTQVTVIDGVGAVAKSTANVTVTGPPKGSTTPPSQNSPSPSSLPWTWIVIGLVAIAAVVGIALWARRRKGPSSSLPPGGPPPAYGGWPPPAAGGPGSPAGPPPGSGGYPPSPPL
jgi:hypothetical protein